MTDSSPRETTYVANPTSKVHIGTCPHLSKRSVLTEATPEQVESNGLCTHCEKEINGVGRTYFDDLEVALKTYGQHGHDALGRIRTALDGVDHDTVWLPASDSYVALAAEGEALAWVGKGYVRVKGRPLVELPSPQPRAGAGSLKEDVRGDLCEVHFMEKSVDGVCEMCE